MVRSLELGLACPRWHISLLARVQMRLSVLVKIAWGRLLALQYCQLLLQVMLCRNL